MFAFHYALLLLTKRVRNRLFLSFLGIVAGSSRSANSADTEGDLKFNLTQAQAFVFESFRLKTRSMNTFVVHRWWGIK